MKLLLVSGGDLYSPDPVGPKDLLLDGSVTLMVEDKIDRHALDKTKIEYDFIDASQCIVTPGLIDPHVHLLGASGESGFSSQSPMILSKELIQAGITTVVGTLGTNTSTHTMPALLAKAKGLKEEGLHAYIYTGGYDPKPLTLTGSVRTDVLYVDEVVGVGEVAISDERSMHPSARDLARLITDAYIGGLLGGKAGVTHFHVGEGKARRSLVKKVLDQFEIKPESLYPTHIERSKKLMEEAIELARRGAHVDIDTVNEDLDKWLAFYIERSGPLDKLTISSDAHYSEPETRLREIRKCVEKKILPLDKLLALVTRNIADVLKLKGKGIIRKGSGSEVAVFSRKGFELQHLISQGECIYRNGEVETEPRFAEKTNRHLRLDGKAA